MGKHSYHEHDGDADNSSRHQHKDDLFMTYQRLAAEQSWMRTAGFGNKKWTFAWSHDKKLANLMGCGPAVWDHMCLIMWKTSPSGKTTFQKPATRLTDEAHRKMHDGFRHKTGDIKAHLLRIMDIPVKDGHNEL